jgi:hypothetical protein
MSASEVVTVRLLQIPLPLWSRTQQQTDELLREFALAASSLEDHHLPVRLTALIETLNQQYAGTSTEQEQALFAASERGDLVLPELVFQVPAAASEASLALGAMLDEADDYCREGQHLLTLAATEEVVAFRRWYLSEFIRQVSGEPPVAWPDYTGWWPGR